MAMTASFSKRSLNIFYIAAYVKHREAGFLEGKPPAMKAIYFMATYANVSGLEESHHFLPPLSPRTIFFFNSCVGHKKI